jgi:hypothetical protein
MLQNGGLVDWIHLAEDGEQWRAIYGNGPPASIKREGFLNNRVIKSIVF